MPLSKRFEISENIYCLQKLILYSLNLSEIQSTSSDLSDDELSSSVPDREYFVIEMAFQFEFEINFLDFIAEIFSSSEEWPYEQSLPGTILRETNIIVACHLFSMFVMIFFVSQLQGLVAHPVHFH